MPYEVEKSKASATKSACTLYIKFGALTGGIYKRQGTWQQFAQNSHGYAVPQLIDGTQGYDLCRVELDNFRDDVLLHLLIDALERVIDGAEYYYRRAQTLWRDTIVRQSAEAAVSLIRRAVEETIRPFMQAMRDLRDRLETRWEELTADEDVLVDQVERDRDLRVEELQERIDDLQAQIDALEEEQDRLQRRQSAYEATAEDVLAFLRAVKRTVVPDIPAVQGRLESADRLLTAYGETQETEQSEAVAGHFDPARVPIRDVVECSAQAATVFQRARSGAQAFSAELTLAQQSQITSAARDDLKDQQGTMTVDLPDLPAETATALRDHIATAETLLEQAQRHVDAIPAAWMPLMQQLIRHYVRDDMGWNPWDDWEDGAWRQR